MALTQLNLEDLDGRNGLAISGLDLDGGLGSSVSNAGDVNGDGFDDLIIGAPRAGEITRYYSPYGGFEYDARGEVYVVFGTTNGFEPELDLTTFDGSNGFTISGLDENDNLGRSVSSAGDINGDGIDDLVIGASGAGYSSFSREGEVYVVFGTTEGFEPELDLTTLDGNNGFAISGLDENDRLGRSVSSAGDVNGDGIDDLVIGAPYADGGTAYYGDKPGDAYVVFGTTEGFEPELDLTTLDGTNGFTISGIDLSDSLGRSVSSAGDVNGDGIDDLIIGAPGYYSSSAGKAYVVFGTTEGFEPELDLTALDGSNGFTISGLDEGDRLGISVSSAGDVNGDGIDDIIIGASGAGRGGETYVLFGSNDEFSSNLDLTTLDGSNGFTISSIDESDSLGRSVSSAGDFNGDGFDDLIIGAPYADSSSYDSSEGKVYLLFGKSDGFEPGIDLTQLDAKDGLVISGLDGSDFFGSSVSNGGDVNGDGFDDLIIGAPSNYATEGKAYIIFGFNPLEETPEIRGTGNNDVLTGTPEGETISGLGGNDILKGLAGNDTLLGGNGKDTLRGNAGDDLLKGEQGFDLLVGDLGNDTLSGGLGSDTLRGGANDDLLQGNSGFDVLFGNNGNDTLLGGNGNDKLRGDGGSDRLDGGLGNDNLFGGAGADLFVLKSGEGNDVIADYADGIDQFVLGGGLEFSDLTIVQNINNTQIQITGTNEVLATLNSVTANFLNADDFIVES
ncbi:MAG: calcium-binding protein [Xenococcaceae cyanobacterium MO_167.B52]|nr:calcium-binding protein [Xenococcaceae cyanobacterium MO_167.B52]